MEFSAGRSLAKQYKRLLQANDKLYKGRELHKKTSGSPLNIETIKQTHKIMIDKARHRDGKDVLVGECRKSLVFPGFHIFAPTGCNQRYVEDAIFRFHKIKKMIELWLLQICLETLSIYIHLKMEKKLLLDFGQCFDADEMLSISSNFNLFS